MHLLADENLDHRIIRGLVTRTPTLDLLTVQDAGLRGHDDRDVLAWAADHGRILLTHDRKTIRDPAYDRVARGLPMPGVLVIPMRHDIGAIINELLMIAECSDAMEWKDQVVFIPL
jgi:hypothetical protein